MRGVQLDCFLQILYRVGVLVQFDARACTVDIHVRDLVGIVDGTGEFYFRTLIVLRIEAVDTQCIMSESQSGTNSVLVPAQIHGVVIITEC